MCEEYPEQPCKSPTTYTRCKMEVTDIAFQEYGEYVEFFVPEQNIVNAEPPYQYLWNFDQKYLEFVDPTTNSLSSEKILLKWKNNKPDTGAVLVGVSITDSKNCHSYKECTFIIFNDTIIGQTPHILCDSEMVCFEPEIEFINVTKNSFEVHWTNVNQITDVIVSHKQLGLIVTQKLGTSTPLLVSGLLADTEYEVKVITYCPSSGTYLETIADVTTRADFVIEFVELEEKTFFRQCTYTTIPLKLKLNIVSGYGPLLIEFASSTGNVFGSTAVDIPEGTVGETEVTVYINTGLITGTPIITMSIEGQDSPSTPYYEVMTNFTILPNPDPNNPICDS